MKQIVQYVAITFLLFTTLMSCSKDEEVIPAVAVEQEVINYFKEIALGFEFSGVNITEVTRKWTKEMKIYVDGEKPDALVQELHTIIEEINMLATDGFKMSITTDKLASNYHLFLGKSTDYLQEYPGDANLVASNFGIFMLTWNDDNSFYDGRMFVDTERAEVAAQKHLLREELTQSLGLAKDSDKYQESIFQSAWTTTQNYAEIDKKLIRLLYHPKMALGLNANQVETLIKTIALK